jgi:hypothetical protein
MYPPVEPSLHNREGPGAVGILSIRSFIEEPAIQPSSHPESSQPWILNPTSPPTHRNPYPAPFSSILLTYMCDGGGGEMSQIHTHTLSEGKHPVDLHKGSRIARSPILLLPFPCIDNVVHSSEKSTSFTQTDWF